MTANINIQGVDSSRDREIFHSVFRTDAWITAWMETYGKQPGVQLVDIGDGSLRDCFYLGRQKWKSILPLQVLTPVGVQSLQVTSPRSEYNDFGRLNFIDKGCLERLLTTNWQAISVPDVLNDSPAYKHLEQLAVLTKSEFYVSKVEKAYSIRADSMDAYLKQLSSPIRSKYFHRRERLLSLGTVEYQKIPMSDWGFFLKQLNDFHIKRWGVRCYSDLSAGFFKLFCEDLMNAGGGVALECIRVDGRPVSVLFDIIWKGRRYNLQSGYDQNLRGVSLGAIHLGYAIEDAITNGQVYDLMAGQGKVNNYKKDIATHEITISSILLLRSYVRYARAIYDILVRR